MTSTLSPVSAVDVIADVLSFRLGGVPSSGRSGPLHSLEPNGREVEHPRVWYSEDSWSSEIEAMLST